MRPESKLSDFFYQDPQDLTPECQDELALAQQAKDKAAAMKLWNEKFYKQVNARREACLMNVSNYAFMIGHLGGPKDEAAKKALETYYMKPGFIRRGEVRGLEREFICNYDKALSMVEKTTFEEVTKPVYGGAYE